MSEWKRLDHGEFPAVGEIVAVVTWRAGQMPVEVKERMRVEVVFERTRSIHGPSLPFLEGRRIQLPDRPDNPEGDKIVMWRRTD